MGRKPLSKAREDNPNLRREWISVLSPLYLREGMKRHNMDDIAAELGVSKATLYKHYSSRQEILEEIVKNKLEELRVFEQYLMNNEVPFTERYQKAVKAAALVLAGISNAFLLDVKELHEHLWVSIRDFQDYALKLAREFYQRGIEEGILHEIDPNLLAVTDKMFIRAVSDPQFLIDNNLSLQTAFEGYFLMKSKGIFKRKED